MTELQLPSNYDRILTEVKSDVRAARHQATLAANSWMIKLYLSIGHKLALQDKAWGTKIVEQFSTDLKQEFPGVTGLSRRNLFYMKKVSLAWFDANESVRQAMGAIPWGHHVLLVTKVKEPSARHFYLHRIIQDGWSLPVLTVQVENNLYGREGKAFTNFAATLPPEESDLAQQVIKDPYVFDFLSLAEPVREQALEQGLIDHIQKFLMELGVGFAFVGRQKHLEVAGRDFYIDLLFYHLKLRCYVVVELKTVEFEPEFAGKLNFYLSAVDDLMRHKQDGPTIGLLLCKSKNQVVVEYALRDMKKPMGVADWRVRLVESLPSVEEIEAELGTEN